MDGIHVDPTNLPTNRRFLSKPISKDRSDPEHANRSLATILATASVMRDPAFRSILRRVSDTKGRDIDEHACSMLLFFVQALSLRDDFDSFAASREDTTFLTSTHSDRLADPTTLYPEEAATSEGIHLVTSHTHWKVSSTAAAELPLWARLEISSSLRTLLHEDLTALGHRLYQDNPIIAPELGEWWLPDLTWEPSCWGSLALHFSHSPTGPDFELDGYIDSHVIRAAINHANTSPAGHCFPFAAHIPACQPAISSLLRASTHVTQLPLSSLLSNPAPVDHCFLADILHLWFALKQWLASFHSSGISPTAPPPLLLQAAS